MVRVAPITSETRTHELYGAQSKPAAKKQDTKEGNAASGALVYSATKQNGHPKPSVQKKQDSDFFE